MAAFFLGRNRKLDVGTAIIQVPLHHPVKLAERVAMLDQLSQGRFLCGIGRGQFPLDFEVFGQDIAKSHLSMRQAWDVVERAWSGRVALESDEFWPAFRDVDPLPKPRSKPRPRVYCAATSPSTVEWAAARGMPMMLLFYLEDELKKSNIELWSEVAAQHGYDPSPAQHIISTVAHVASTTEQARAEVAGRFIWWALEADVTDKQASDPGRMEQNYEFHYGLRAEAVLRGERSVEDDLLDKLFRLCPIGSPSYCIDRLCEQMELLGTRHFVAGFEGLAGRQNVIRSMSRFMNEVVPHVSAYAETASSHVWR
jgi:alkanal monooxygenase alpha chain